MQHKTLAFLHAHHPGKILEAARKTLELEPIALLTALAEKGVDLSLKEYLLFEQDEATAMTLGTTLWFHLCEAMELSTDAITDGYSEKIHLTRILAAVQQGTFALPLTESLAQRLEEEKKIPGMRTEKNVV